MEGRRWQGVGRPKLLKIASLWAQESEKTGGHMTGKVGDLKPGFEFKAGMRLLIFKNKEPKGPTSPTHFLMTPDQGQQEKEEEAPGW
jgi:hypothetical protein